MLLESGKGLKQSLYDSLQFSDLYFWALLQSQLGWASPRNWELWAADFKGRQGESKILCKGEEGTEKEEEVEMSFRTGKK